MGSDNLVQTYTDDHIHASEVDSKIQNLALNGKLFLKITEKASNNTSIASKEKLKQLRVGRNVEVITKIKTGGNAFSAIPWKEIKFDKSGRREISNKRSKVFSQDITSRNSQYGNLNGQSSTRSKGKGSRKNINSSMEIRQEKRGSLKEGYDENMSPHKEVSFYSGTGQPASGKSKLLILKF